MKKYIIPIAIIFIACLAVYSNSYLSSFHFDDEVSIIRNAAIRHVEDAKAVWDFWPTRFLTNYSFAVNYALGALNVVGYHIFNVLIHLFAALFAWWLALLTLNTPALKDDSIKGQAAVLALFVGLIFAVHPLQTQAVTYIVQRATALAALFYLATLSLYVKARLSEKGWGYYSGALAAAICASFSKETVVTLPFMIILYEFVFMRPEKKISWARIAPFLAIAMLIPGIALLTKSFDLTSMRRVAEEPPAATSLQYLFTQFRVLINYIRLLFIPIPQNVAYEVAPERSFFTVPIAVSFSYLAAVLTGGLVLFKKYRLISFCIFWFFLTLIPESSIFPIRDLMFEHRLYLPMFGYGLLIASLAYYLIGRKNTRIMVTALICITLFYSALAFTRNFVWKDEISLWNDVIKKSPESAGAYSSRGNAYAAKGDIDQAIADYDRAIMLDPEFVDVYNNRANAYKKKGDMPKAIADYVKVLQFNPFHVPGLYNLGVTFMEEKDYDKAIDLFTKAIQLDPRMAESYNGRGNCYIQKGDIDRAIPDFENAVQYNPHLLAARFMLGISYTRKSDFEKAITAFTDLIRIEPGNPANYDSRGVVYAMKGDMASAMADFNKAVEVDPRFAPAYCNRGNVYMTMGDLDRAIADFNKTIELNPGFAKAFSDRERANALKAARAK